MSYCTSLFLITCSSQLVHSRLGRKELHSLDHKRGNRCRKYRSKWSCSSGDGSWPYGTSPTGGRGAECCSKLEHSKQQELVHSKLVHKQEHSCFRKERHKLEHKHFRNRFRKVRHSLDRRRCCCSSCFHRKERHSLDHMERHSLQLVHSKLVHSCGDRRVRHRRSLR